MKLYSVDDIVEISGFSKAKVYYTISDNNITADKIINNKRHYNESQLYQIVSQKTIVIEKYYPLKTTETFYIYESKMNGL